MSSLRGLSLERFVVDLAQQRVVFDLGLFEGIFLHLFLNRKIEQVTYCVFLARDLLLHRISRGRLTSSGGVEVCLYIDEVFVLINVWMLFGLSERSYL